jgi:hypothetical protein
VDGAQAVSSRWPEIYVTEDWGAPTLTGTRSDTTKYEDVFETYGTNTVDNVIMPESDGTTTISWNDLLSKYTAIDLAQLVSQNLLLKLPDGVSDSSAGAPNFLWLFKKISSTSGTDDSLEVTVFNLIKVEKQETVNSGNSTTGDLVLTYKRIF